MEVLPSKHWSQRDQGEHWLRVALIHMAANDQQALQFRREKRLQQVLLRYRQLDAARSTAALLGSDAQAADEGQAGLQLVRSGEA